MVCCVVLVSVSSVLVGSMSKGMLLESVPFAQHCKRLSCIGVHMLSVGRLCVGGLAINRLGVSVAMALLGWHVIRAKKRAMTSIMPAKFTTWVDAKLVRHTNLTKCMRRGGPRRVVAPKVVRK